MYCSVYIFDAPYHIDRAFDYLLTESAERGAIVRVPFGKANKTRLGVIYSLSEEVAEDKNIKPVQSVLRDRPPMSEEMLGLCLFLKEHTLCTFGEAARTVLPPGALSENLNVKVKKIYSLAVSREEAEALLSKNATVRSEGQKNVIRYLLNIGSAESSLVRELPGVTAAQISSLCEKGILSFEEEEELRNPYAALSQTRDESPINLSAAQQKAYESIEGLYLE